MTEKELKMNNMASPNKIKNVGYDYKPFQMKASGTKYKNSPINKNYGSPAQRGFDFTGGVGSTEKEGGVGSSLLMKSPAKGFLPNIVKNMFKKKKKNPAEVAEDPTVETGGDLEGRVAALETASSGGSEAVTAPPVPDPAVEDPAVKPDAKQAMAGGVAGEQAQATASIDPNKQSVMDKFKPTNQAQGKFMGI